MLFTTSVFFGRGIIASSESCKEACQFLQEHNDDWTHKLKKIFGSTITLTIANIQYKQGLLSFYDMISIYELNPIVIAIDRDTCNYLSNYTTNILCIHQRFTNLKRPDLVGIAKIVAPMIALKCGKDVIFSEMDVFWFSNPMLELTLPDNRIFDVQVQGHIHPRSWKEWYCQINIGFFFVRTSFASQKLFSEMFNFVSENFFIFTSAKCGDQQVFDFFIRFSKGRLPANELSSPGFNESKYMQRVFAKELPTNNATWRRLPIHLYRHIQGHSILIPPEEKIPGQMILAHSYAGTPENRIYCGYELGVVKHASYTIPKAFQNYTCFKSVAELHPLSGW